MNWLRNLTQLSTSARVKKSSTGPLNLLAAVDGLETPILFLQRPGTFLAIVWSATSGRGWCGDRSSTWRPSAASTRRCTSPADAPHHPALDHLRDRDRVPAELGNILELGFDQIFSLYHPLVYDVATSSAPTCTGEATGLPEGLQEQRSVAVASLTAAGQPAANAASIVEARAPTP